MVDEFSETVADLIPVLRSNLNATEISLAKFTSAMRRLIILKSSKTPDTKTESVSTAIEMVNKMQVDFNQYKSNIDLILAICENIPQ